MVTLLKMEGTAIFARILPPSQPSPRGEGAKNLSPLGENERGLKSIRNTKRFVTEILKDYTAGSLIFAD
jgi:hypothetical protein